MEQLEQIAGFYVNKETRAISVKPTEVTFEKYFMPSTLGHSEYEDIGARLVEVAREQGQWVGMAYSTLGKQLATELEGMCADTEKRIAEMNNANKGILAKAYESTKSLFGGKQHIIESRRPDSILTFWLFTQGQNGPAILGSEIRGMADKGYLDIIEQGDQTVLVPTQKFVETVYKAQQLQKRSA